MDGRTDVPMVGNVGTGEFAHAWAHELRQIVFDADVEVDDPGTEHGRRLVRALGARIRDDV